MAAIIFSLFGLLSYGSSYFFRKKANYLMFQGLGGVFLAVSYLFDGNFFAMISLFISIARIFCYYIYEYKNKFVPVLVVVLFCMANVANYVVVNICIKHTASLVDIIMVVSFVLYNILFSLRNLQVVRYSMTVPLALSITYNILIEAPIFTVLSYTMELVITVFTLIYYWHVNKIKINQ